MEAKTKPVTAGAIFLELKLKSLTVIKIKDLRKNDAKDVIKVRFMKSENNYR